MPTCKTCRSLAYRKRRYPLACQNCGLHTRLDGNQCCRECNGLHGLRQCRACGELLPMELCFYPRKARCKDCLRSAAGGATSQGQALGTGDEKVAVEPG